MNMEKKRDIAAKCLLVCFVIFNFLTTEIFATSKQFRFTGYFIGFLIAIFLRYKFKDKKSE